MINYSQKSTQAMLERINLPFSYLRLAFGPTWYGDAPHKVNPVYATSA